MCSKLTRLRCIAWVGSVGIHVVACAALSAAARQIPAAAAPRVAREARLWIARAEPSRFAPRCDETSRELEVPEPEEPRVVPVPDECVVPPRSRVEPDEPPPEPEPLAEAASAWTPGWDRPFAEVDRRADTERVAEELVEVLEPVARATPPAPPAPRPWRASPASARAAETAPARPDVLLHAPPPAYPRAALRLRLQGTVLCRLTVRADGRVVRVDVLESSGHSVLDEAACDALLQWRFEPRARAASDAPREVPHAVTFRIP